MCARARLRRILLGHLVYVNTIRAFSDCDGINTLVVLCCLKAGHPSMLAHNSRFNVCKCRLKMLKPYER